MVQTLQAVRPRPLLSAALVLALVAGCTQSPIAPERSAHTASTFADHPQLTGKRAIIDFAGLPGPDGRTLTADDEPFTGADFFNTFGTRIIDQEYAQLGVRFAGAGAVGLMGGGFEPDGSPVVDNVVFADFLPVAGSFPAPVTVTFDRGQKAVTFDVFAIVDGLSPTLPIALRDAKGNLVREFQLTNADAILGGERPYLSGRYLVSAPTPFTSMELGLTPGGGGWFLDNLNFAADFAVPGPSLTASAGGPAR